MYEKAYVQSIKRLKCCFESRSWGMSAVCMSRHYGLALASTLAAALPCVTACNGTVSTADNTVKIARHV
jgi:hypothetical protein